MVKKILWPWDHGENPLSWVEGWQVSTFKIWQDVPWDGSAGIKDSLNLMGGSWNKEMLKLSTRRIVIRVIIIKLCWRSLTTSMKFAVSQEFEFGPKCHSIRHVPRGNAVSSPSWNILELDFYICFKGFTGPNPLSPRASSWSPTLTREIWWSKLWWRVSPEQSYLHHFKWDGHLLVTLPIHWSVISINGTIIRWVFLGRNSHTCNGGSITQLITGDGVHLV